MNLPIIAFETTTVTSHRNLGTDGTFPDSRNWRLFVADKNRGRSICPCFQSIGYGTATLKRPTQ